MAEFRKGEHPEGLHWENLRVSAKGMICGKGKEILHGISGHLAPHRLTCVMGPSGAGKSTLMNVLSGRLSSNFNTTVSGSIRHDGEDLSYLALRNRVAYVMQEDCLMATDTPMEALCFSGGWQKM